jgi:tetratricopeptide (TPR) repeat protein
LVVAAIGAGLGGALWMGPRAVSELDSYARRPTGSVTFTKDIAPILYAECAPCHRPGEAAPFSLLSYEDARKRAQQIVKVTADRYMPPFLPEVGPVAFMNTRRLTIDQLGLIQQWVDEGAIEGSAADLPKRPVWTEGWRLGPPDLVLEMPKAYTLAAEGKDVYRNFVIPTSLTSRRYVRAFELRPGTRTIHHAFIQMDSTRNSRRLDEQDADVGFGGITSPVTVESPSGNFASWQPGRRPTEYPPGLPWTLEPGTDIVLQVHLQPSGKPEAVRPSLGLYFTTQGPTNTPFKMALSSYAIDIPAGERAYVLEEHFTLPVDAELLAVLPHAHYLGKRLEGLATLPDGKTIPLVTIPRWDFNWQSDYRYIHPISLPQGTRLSMRYTYDNSADNVRNPHQPPRRVRYGLQSTDEMGELWLQFLTRNPDDLAKLQLVYGRRVAEGSIAFNRFLLAEDPRNAKAYNGLGIAFMALGRTQEALEQFRTAARLKPDFDEAHYHWGVVAGLANNTQEAEREFIAAITANPEHYKARNNLGTIYLEQGRLDAAREQFLEVLRLNPGDANGKANLELVERRRAGQ